MKIRLKRLLPILLLLVLSPIAILYTVLGAANLEQSICLSKVLPVLRSISSPDDKRLKALEHSDRLEFSSFCLTTKLTDGWVVILERACNADPTDTDAPYWHYWFEHRIIAFRDSTGRIYVLAYGWASPPMDVDEKGVGEFGSSEDESISEFFKEVKAGYVPLGWDFWEVKK